MISMVGITKYLAVVCLVVLAAGCRGRRPAAPSVPTPEPPLPAMSVVTTPPWSRLVFPTGQKHLLDERLDGVIQPTAAGHVESGLYGSARNGARGGAHFHEGVDIAALQRDRRGEPMDKVCVVAAGSVGYVNRIGGNSNYGKYVVVLHADPLGEVYTLYAHLAAVDDNIRPGKPLQPGQALGVMGHTSSSVIPKERGHLHFEIGLLNNNRFAEWYRAQRLKPDHGNFHGGNFSGADPLAFFRWQQEHPDRSFKDFLAAQKPAFEMAVQPAHAIDYFRRYPALWEGSAWTRGPVVLTCTENGLPLQGRCAVAADHITFDRSKTAILRVHEDALGRNGCRMVARTAKGWEAGSGAVKWLSVLLY